MAQKKYVSLSKLSTFLDNLKQTFASAAHKHTVSDITDYAVDSTLSSTSTNPVQNKVLNEEFDSVATAMNALESAIDGKSDSSHIHDDRYYTETEINTKLDTINTELDGSIKSLSVSGKTITYTKNDGSTGTITTQDTNTDTKVTNTLSTTTKAYVTGTTSATTNTGTQVFDTGVYLDTVAGQLVASVFKGDLDGNATFATKATQDASGNVIATTYETKASATNKLTEAKTYADSVGATVKNELLNGAGAAYDTLKELGDLIDENTDAIEALETVAASKANVSHTHVIADVTDLTNATQSTAGLFSATDKTQLDYGGTPIVSTEGDGENYTATVNGMTSFVVGMKVTIIPNVTSTTTTPKLNVNGLGAKTIRMPITYNTSLTSTGVIDGWLLANKPVTVQWNGTYWITVDLVRTSAQYLYGAVPIANGGTGATTAEEALINLGITATATELNKLDGVTATTDELNYVAGVTSNIQEQINNKHFTKKITLIISGWTTNSGDDIAPYAFSFFISGIQSTDCPHITPIYDDNLTTALAQQKAWAMVSKAVAEDDTITFYCFEDKPEVDIPIQVEVNR